MSKNKKIKLKAQNFFEDLDNSLIGRTEELRAEVQYMIEKVMKLKKISKAELAKRLDCSRANVSQLLSEDGNPRLETIAKIFHALDDYCTFKSVYLEKLERLGSPQQSIQADLVSLVPLEDSSPWTNPQSIRDLKFARVTAIAGRVEQLPDFKDFKVGNENSAVQKRKVA